ncbi:hypothetical protein HispidOSU_002573 [Sigmodon hispidus]
MASMYDRYMLVATKDEVVVTIQYCLGILGFFRHGRGNRGYLDQVAALHCVQKNIAHFGGNSEQVTIFGESAGGTSVSSHAVSLMYQGLFHRAIIQSGDTLLPGLIANTSEVVYTHSVADRLKDEDEKQRSMGYGCRLNTRQEIRKMVWFFKTTPGVVVSRHLLELLDSVDFHPGLSIIGVNSDEYGWTIHMTCIKGSESLITGVGKDSFQGGLRTLGAQLCLPQRPKGRLLGGHREPQIKLVRSAESDAEIADRE